MSLLATILLSFLACRLSNALVLSSPPFESKYSRNQIVLDRGPVVTRPSSILDAEHQDAPITRVVSLGSPIDASVFYSLLQQHHLSATASPHLAIEHKTYTTHGASITDLASQVTDWQNDDADATYHAAVVSVGLDEAVLGLVRAACGPRDADVDSTADDYQCDTAAIKAYELVSDRSNSPETLRNMLGNVLFRLCVYGRGQHGVRRPGHAVAKDDFRMFVIGHGVPSLTGMDGASLGGNAVRVAMLTEALNGALRESVEGINEDFGFQVAVFVDAAGAEQAPHRGWSSWLRHGRHEPS